MPGRLISKLRTFSEEQSLAVWRPNFQPSRGLLEYRSSPESGARYIEYSLRSSELKQRKTLDVKVHTLSH